MEHRDPKKPASRKAAMWFLIGAVVVTSLAVWLCILGDLPAIKTGDHTYMMFGGMSVNGTQMPGWTFYFIPAGLFVVAGILWIVGWRKSRLSGHEDA
jgi:hypothetical protein